MDIFNLVLIAILIALTAFFVTSEFAIVKIRSSRIDQLIEEGSSKAVSAKRVISNLDEYLSACQLGITITALGLGWIGESTIEHLLGPLFISLNLPDNAVKILSISIAFGTITFLHVVVGELAPKTLAIQKAEWITLKVARPLILFYKIMYPFIWVLNGSARIISRIFGLKPVSENEIAHTEEELRIILSESYKSGEINQSEFKYVNKIFDFDNRIAKEIMVPRTEIVSLSKDDSLDAFLSTIREEKFTRYPVIDGDKDHIVGIVNAKEVMTDFIGNEQLSAQTLEGYIRPIIRVIETIPIHDLLVKMQKERMHMAVLMDEYGGTSGLVTVEDILEEIVGEIRDEFDMDEIPEIRKIKENHYIIDSKVLVSEVNDLLGVEINDEDVDTIGGWILTENYDAKEGDIIAHETYTFKIIEMEDHHIKYIEVMKSINDGEPTNLKQVSLSNSEVLY
ncbi:MULTISPECIES: hemolysin family protein [Neobacillus]|uniref:HlyC/CorC family transporter n=2 Tax=Neobacillus TaxID=2675232 RepID=A0A942U4G6_9BACI|nr:MULTISPECIES: hemolysin family protein [Neobacillus]MBS4212261.1 HlyC/CorC family transporter [Neobacillus rhizophilus]MBU8915696.1 hemolysin family protein [Bacillus sp. FJAT-29953]MCH6268313.1 hemolysin family protein [Neobacillus citreus]